MTAPRWCDVCKAYQPEGHEISHAPSLFDPPPPPPTDLAEVVVEQEVTRNLVEGERLKAEGQAGVTANTPDGWRTSFDGWVEHLPTGSEFTATDVLEGVGYPPREVHPNTIGARLTALAKRGIIDPVGYRKSERPQRHAGIVRVWRRSA